MTEGKKPYRRGIKTRPRAKPFIYFIYRGDLHRKLHLNRPANILTAWNCRLLEVVQYPYSDVRINGGAAYPLREVAKLLNRSPKTLKQLIRGKEIPEPHRAISRDTGAFLGFYWDERGIMDLHGHLSTVHRGRPRKDGLISPMPIPTAAELRAQLRNGTVLYVKVADGEFVPTWQADY